MTERVAGGYSDQHGKPRRMVKNKRTAQPAPASWKGRMKNYSSYRKRMILALAKRWSTKLNMAPHIETLAGLLVSRAPKMAVSARALKEWYYKDKEWRAQLDIIFQVQRGRMLQNTWDQAYGEKGQAYGKMWAIKIDPDLSERSVDTVLHHNITFPQMSFIPGGGDRALAGAAQNALPAEDVPALVDSTYDSDASEYDRDAEVLDAEVIEEDEVDG